MPEAVWASVKNGKLLALIEEAGYRAFITCDKNMESQRPLHLRPFAILLLSTNHCPSMEPHISANRTAYVSVSRSAHDAQLFTNDCEKLPVTLGHEVSGESAHRPEQSIAPRQEIGPRDEQ